MQYPAYHGHVLCCLSALPVDLSANTHPYLFELPLVHLVRTTLLVLLACSAPFPALLPTKIQTICPFPQL